MQAILVTLVVLWSLAGGQGDTFCTVPQWEGVRHSLYSRYKGTGDPTVSLIGNQISYDMNNSRVALKALDIGDDRADYIYDYSKGVLYIMERGHCTKSQLTGPFSKWCTPEDAVMAWGKTWLGGAGPDEVLWILGFTSRANDINYHASFSQFPLVPVFETSSGHIDGDPVYLTSNFMNVSVGIKDPSVFIPPASCKEVQMQFIKNTRSTFGLFPL